MARKSAPFVKSPNYNSFEDVNTEMLRVQEGFNTLALHSATEVSHEHPDKVIPLQIVYADGVNWNPGKGEGLYIRVGEVWRKFTLE